MSAGRKLQFIRWELCQKIEISVGKIRSVAGENQCTNALIVEVALMLDKLSNTSTDFPLNPVGER